jgi:hypothetical protein
VPFEVEAQVPFDLEDIVIDWAEIESSRDHTSLLATVSPRKEVALLLHTLRQAGVEPRVVEAEGFVLGNLVGLFSLPGRRIVLDLGRSFPVAGARSPRRSPRTWPWRSSRPSASSTRRESSATERRACPRPRPWRTGSRAS